MAESSAVRIRVPSKITPNEEFQARTLVVHPMEIVQRDAQGKAIEKNYNFIHTVVVTYNGKEIMRGEMTQAVSANPLIAFPLKVSEPGTLTVTFEDTTGAKHSGSVDIKF
ncbi:MAG: thiosulfate oxidation carrier complex protein SoxZ [Pseudomonadota bacterium]